MRNGHGVRPIDPARIRRLFGQESAPGDPPRVCLECETLGHICRHHRAERYYAREAAKRRWWARMSAWYRSTTLYTMSRDYPLAVPLLFAAGAWWACFALLVVTMALGL